MKACLLQTVTNVNIEHLVETNHAEVQSYTVLICTANRSNEIRVALNSLVEAGIRTTRVIVVDQSETDATQDVINSYLSAIQLTYIRTKTRGKCAAANLAMRFIKTEFVVMLDDDCAATPGWSESLLDAMLTNDDVAVVYGTVAPAFVCPGGFNEAFGPGSRFRSCSDGELSLRCISKGFHIMETPNSTVIHYGFRTFSQGRMLAFNSFYGIAASCLQTMFKGHPGALLVLLDEIITHALWPTIVSIVRLRPTGLSRITGFIGGLLAMTVYTIRGILGSKDDTGGGPTPRLAMPTNGFAITDPARS